MNVQFIECNGQPQYAVIPVEWYAELLKKADFFDDIQAFDQAVANNEELIPQALLSRLIKGENPLTVWREFRQLSSAQLAEQVGTTPETIVAIENNALKPDAVLLKKLAGVLNVDVDDLADCSDRV